MKEIWIYERCLEESKKYKNRTEFQEKNVSAYRKSLNMGWIDDFVWLKRSFGVEYDKSLCEHFIYAYIFQDNSVYVGLSKSSNRFKEHKTSEKSSEYKYSIEKNIIIPTPIILEDKLTVEIASVREGYWVEFYKNKGCYIINKTKTGSVGSIGYKWTYEECYKCAQLCSSRSEFESVYSGGYKISKRNGWIDDYIWFETKRLPNGYWTYEKCKEASLKYEYVKDFKKCDNVAYVMSVNNKWIDTFVWLKRTKRKCYTFDECNEIAKKCRNKYEFKQLYGSAFNVAYKNKWLELFF